MSRKIASFRVLSAAGIVTTAAVVGGAIFVVGGGNRPTQKVFVQSSVPPRATGELDCGLGKPLMCGLPGELLTPEEIARYDAEPTVAPDPNAPDPFAPENTVPKDPNYVEPPSAFPGCHLPDENGYLGCDDTFHQIGVNTTTTTTTTIPNHSPVCTSAVVALNRLWPGNHDLTSVTVSGVTDPDGDQVALAITGVTQDEPLLGTGSGDTSPDAVLVSGATVKVRAERAGNGDGRVYRIGFTATDSRDAVCSAVVVVSVPKNNNGSSAIDSGLIVNSLG